VGWVGVFVGGVYGVDVFVGVVIAADGASDDAAKEALTNIAMQVAAMNPVALDEASVPQAVKDEELKVAIEKTKEEQVKKAVEAALKKAKVVESRIMPMAQGQKQSRLVAWTFCANGEREKWRRERWSQAADPTAPTIDPV
jgi:translation elongation factor EF-Ts